MAAAENAAQACGSIPTRVALVWEGKRQARACVSKGHTTSYPNGYPHTPVRFWYAVCGTLPDKLAFVNAMIDKTAQTPYYKLNEMG